MDWAAGGMWRVQEEEGEEEQRVEASDSAVDLEEV
jgi:hypothetical protein